MARRGRDGGEGTAEPRLGTLHWSTDEQRSESVQKLYDYAVEKARSWIGWYDGATRPNKRRARLLRGWSIVLVSIAGLIPVLSQIRQDDSWTIEPAWASVALGLAVALIALDRFYGYSSAWARFTIARFELEARLNTFQLEWQSSLNDVNGLDRLTVDEARRLIDCVEGFIGDFDAIVQRETASWVAEFRTALESIEAATKSSESTGARGTAAPP